MAVEKPSLFVSSGFVTATILASVVGCGGDGGVREATGAVMQAGDAISAERTVEAEPLSPLECVSHVVYVESNDPRPGMNAVLAYQRADDGSLTALPGSPFPTGGRGVGDPTQELGPLDSDQSVVLSLDHRLLFAVNAGSNSIAVFHVHDDGSLTAAPDSPYSSGGVNPVSVGVAGDRLYVVNKDGDPAQIIPGSLPSYTGFDIHRDGRLTPIPGSTVTAPAGSSPSQALISRDRRFLFDAQFMAGQIQSFRITERGYLVAPPGGPEKLPTSISPPLVLGLAAYPYQRILYANFVAASRLGVYSYDDDGSLTFLSDVANSGAAPCWLLLDRAATSLYAVNTGDSSVSRFELSDPRAPTQVEHVSLAGPGNPFQEALDPEESFLFVVSQRTTTNPSDPTGNGLHVLRVGADGSLSEVPSSPLALPVPPFARPQGVAAL